MIDIKCNTKDTICITDMVPFQGKLKKRTQQDIDQLKESLCREGLLMPFAIWKKTIEDKQELYLLDGHGRKEALVQMAVDEPALLKVKWPCVYIEADTEDDARKALLQITSSYGKITSVGYKQFCVSIPDYKAPSIQKFVGKIEKKTVETNTEATESKELKEPVIKKKVIRIRVPEDRMTEVINIFKQFKFIEVL